MDLVWKLVSNASQTNAWSNSIFPDDLGRLALVSSVL